MRHCPKRCAETGREPPDADMRQRAASEVNAICQAGLAELVLVAHGVGTECRERGIPLVARGSATCSLVVWALGLVEGCPIDDGLDGNMFIHDGRPDLPDLDLEVPSAYEPTVAALVERAAAAAWQVQRQPQRAELPAVSALRLGISVSMGSRQAVRVVGAALGLEAPRVNALARQVPLLSSPGAIEQVMTRGPELGVADSPQSEPFKTILCVAAKLEGLPYRQGAHPSAYTFSFFSRSALDWFACPVGWHRSAGAESTLRRGTARGSRRPGAAAGSALAHPGSAPNQQQRSVLLFGEADLDYETAQAPIEMLGDRPVLVAQWERLVAVHCERKQSGGVGVCSRQAAPSWFV